MAEPRFLLDANILIEAARRYYPFDLVPSFWTRLVDLTHRGRVLSIDRVREECLRGNDALAAWVKKDFAHAFRSTADSEVVVHYARIVTWVCEQSQFMDAAKAEFAGVADGWLVAYAGVHGCVVVTHEAFTPEARRKVPIPNLCQAFSVPYLDTWAMRRQLGERLT